MRHLLLTLAIFCAAPASAETTLRVMSFNIWGAGGNEGKGIEETVAVLKVANADMIGVQETRLEGPDCPADSCPAQGVSVAPQLAAALGYFYFEQSGDNVALWSNAIQSRYPIVNTAPHDLGASFEVDGRTVWLFNLHLDDSPYGPYQLLNIPYGDAPFLTTAAEAQDSATRTRGPAPDLVAAALAAADGADAVFVTGDFNEPSAHDWTAATVAAGFQPLPVAWPSSARIEGLGLVDTYRAVWPDATTKPAFTWTPRYDEAARDDHPDRIDYVLARAESLIVSGAWIVGETGPRSDLAVDPWPSDHRAALAEVRF